MVSLGCIILQSINKNKLKSSHGEIPNEMCVKADLRKCIMFISTHCLLLLSTIRITLLDSFGCCNIGNMIQYSVVLCIKSLGST